MTNEERLSDFFVLQAGTGRKYYTFGFSKRFAGIKALGADIPNRVFYDNYALELPVPLPLVIEKGKQTGDLNHAGVLVGSRCLLDLFRCLDVDSVRASPVVVYDRKDRDLLDVELYWLGVRKCAGPVDRTRGAPLLSSPDFPKHLDRPNNIGLYFDVGSWDGSEVFMCSNHGAVIVTTRVAHAIQAAELENVKLTAILEYGKEIRDFLLSAGKHHQGPSS